MKVCPKCNAHYENDTFFCLQDGTPLKETDSVKISRDAPDQIDDDTAVFPSEQTFIKNKESAEPNKSEATIIRPSQEQSQVTFIRPKQNRYEVKTDQPKPSKNNNFALQTELASSNSSRNYMLRTAGLAIGAFIVIVGMCVLLSYLDNQPNSAGTLDDTSEDLNGESSPNDLADQTTPESTAILDSANTDLNNSAKPNDIEPSDTISPDIPLDEIAETPTPESIRKGKISGKLTYPSEGIPLDMHVCIVEISSGRTACSNRKKDGFDFKVNRSAVNYSVSLPVGTYYIYAILGGEKAFYTEFVRCGMDISCKSHRKIPIVVKDGKTVGGIMVGDWYDY